jgi:hypothetical protein
MELARDLNDALSPSRLHRLQAKLMDSIPAYTPKQRASFEAMQAGERNSNWA